MLVHFSEPVIRARPPWEDPRPILSSDLVLTLSDGPAALSGWGVVEWPSLPAANLTGTLTNDASSARQLSLAGELSAIRVAIELRLDSALDAQGQQVSVGARRGRVSDLAYNRMGTELRVAGTISSTAAGIGGMIDVFGIGLLSVSPSAAISMTAAACTAGGLLACACCYWWLGAICRWLRRKQQAVIVKEHVAELKRLITAEPSNGRHTNEAVVLERLVTGEPPRHLARDLASRQPSRELSLLSKVAMHVESKKGATYPEPAPCSCPACNSFAPVAQEAHVQHFGFMASDHLEAIKWMRSLFDETEVPTVRFDLSKLPSSVLLAAFSFDESVFSIHGCQRLLHRLRDNVNDAAGQRQPSRLPEAVLAVGRELCRARKSTVAPLPTDDEVVLLLQSLLNGSRQVSKRPSRQAPARLPPVLSQIGSELHVVVASPLHRPSPSRSDASPSSSSTGTGVQQPLYHDLNTLPALVLLAAAILELGQAAYADGTFQEMLRRLHDALGGERDSSLSVATRSSLPPTVVETGRHLSALKQPSGAAASDNTVLSVLLRELEDACVPETAERALSVHTHGVLLRACGQLYNELLSSVPSGLKLSVMKQQLDACLTACPLNGGALVRPREEVEDTLSRLDSVVDAVEADALFEASVSITSSKRRSSASYSRRQSIAGSEPSYRSARRSKASRASVAPIPEGAMYDESMNDEISWQAPAYARTSEYGPMPLFAADSLPEGMYDVGVDAELSWGAVAFDDRQSSYILGPMPFFYEDEEANDAAIDPDEERNANGPSASSMEPEPLRRAPTSQQLESIGEQAEREVSERCLYVKLDMAKRRIILLEPIRFHGSRFEGGVDVFFDQALAKTICDEIAIAIEIVNDLLSTNDLAAFGLQLEGHTSASIHGQAESLNISTLRAKQCERAVKRYLTAKASKHRGEFKRWGHALSLLIAHRGWGDTRPLPGFDDGGNYVENRRVEVNLIESTHEDYLVPPKPVWERLVDVGAGGTRPGVATTRREPVRPTSNFAKKHRVSVEAPVTGMGRVRQHKHLAVGEASLLKSGPPGARTQPRPTSAKRSDAFLKNYARSRYGQEAKASSQALTPGQRLDQLADTPERPKLFRVVTECTLQERPLQPVGGGVRVRPLALVDSSILEEEIEDIEPPPLWVRATAWVRGVLARSSYRRS